jgi:type II secretory pathway pseudopilin PulG
MLMRHRGLRSQTRQRGYIMITLMLALALIMLALLTVLPDIRQQVRRDREEELRHRGNAYMRAIQHYYKKFGRYPSRVEELENTNNLRFLRKRYKDPVNIDPNTGKEKDFKFLTQLDVSINNGPLLGALPGANGPGAQSPLGGAGTQFGGLQPAGASNQTPHNASDDSSSGTASGNPSSGSSSPNSTGDDDANATGKSSSASSSGLGGRTFGGGPIIGVASMNKKDKAIHVFYDKDHYNDWYFIYLPQADVGGLLKGPLNPNMPTPNLNGQLPQGGIGQGGGSGLSRNTIQNQGQAVQTQPQQPPQTPPPAPEQ